MPCIVSQAAPHSACEDATLLTARADEWIALAESREDPESSKDETKGLFLSACQILRGAQGLEALNARWHGQRNWFSENLPEPAMLALCDLFRTLKETKN